MSAHEFSFTSIDGQPMPMTAYAGKAVLLVNTASECGFTPQYAGLQLLWEDFRDRGAVVIGVPSNDFGSQEPGSEDEIQDFCRSRFQVDFPMTTKQTVVGPEAHPLYRWIADSLGEDHAPKWNFHKYLIGPDGELAGVWPSAVAPNNAEIRTSIESQLMQQN